MKNYKQFIAGFVTCFILLSFIFIPGYAEDVLKVVASPYTILFNGQKANITAYSINDVTYVPLSVAAKYFGYTATSNETTKQIEVNTVINTSLIKEIKMDPNTGNPIDAEQVEYKGYKALKYNDNIYVSSFDISYIFKTDKNFYLKETKQNVYLKGEKKVIVNLSDTTNRIKFGSWTYYNVNLFNDFIGE